MGTDISAVTMIGLRVPHEKMFAGVEKTPRFDHERDYPREWKVDPVSGRELWWENPIPVKGYDPERWTFGSYAAVPFDDGRFERGSWTMIAILRRETASDRCPGPYFVYEDVPTEKWLSENKARLRWLIEQAGLEWCEDNFGLWTYLNISY